LQVCSLRPLLMNYKWPKYQRWFLRGLILASVVSLVNSVLVIKYELYGGEDGGFAMAFPIIAFAVVYLSVIVHRWVHFEPGRMWLGADSRYVEERNHNIWTRLVPFWMGGNSAGGSFRAQCAFIRGKYDDGKDERLNRIKHEMKVTHNLWGGGAFLLLFVGMLNLILFSSYR
jgi:hypothetical protein